MSARRQLRLLLCELFDAGDLRVFARDWYTAVVPELPEGPIEPSELFARAIEVFERHQAIDATFFERLKKEREGRAADIDAVRAAWEHELAEGGLVSDPGDALAATPRFSPRLKMIVLAILLVVSGAAGGITWVLWPRCPTLAGHIEGVGACEAFVSVAGQGRARVGPDGSFSLPLRCPLPESLDLMLEVASFEEPLERAVPRDEVGHVELRLSPACGGTHAIRGRVSFVGAGPIAGARVDRLGCEASGSSNDSGIFHLGGLSEQCSRPPIQLRVQAPIERQAHRLMYDSQSVAALGSPPFFEIELPRDDAFPEREAPVAIEEVQGQSARFAERPALGADVPATLVPALASIGRLEMVGQTPHAGTGFVAGPALVITSRRVAEALGGTRAGARFSNAQFVLPNETIPLARVRMLHGFWDLAILELAQNAQAPALDLVAARPDPFEGREIALVGYPAPDPSRPSELVQRVFGAGLGVQRIQLGVLAGTGEVSGHEAIVHDVLTMAGQPGSPLLDLETGEVIGIHFAWAADRGSFAAPGWELYADRHLRAMPVAFRSSHRPTPQVESVEPAPPEPSHDEPDVNSSPARPTINLAGRIGPRLEPLRPAPSEVTAERPRPRPIQP